MNREKIRHGLTLVELVLAAVLSVVAAVTVISGYNFLFVQTKSGIGRGNLNLQIDYALEKIRLQCLGASSVEDEPLFSAGTGGETASFCITGEKDPYNIDISVSGNKKRYCYGLDGSRSLTLTASNTSGANEEVEILIDSRHSPGISFKYSAGSEPNYITAMITATARDVKGIRERPMKKEEGIRFWYTTVIK